MSGRGWLIWFLASAGTFLFFEVGALVSGRSERTLSAAIWRFERFRTGQPLHEWSAPHFLLMLVLGGLFLWLFFHFSLGWWR